MAILRVKDDNGNIIDIPAIKGYTPKKGVDYFDGKDGYTPVKGTDYWTDEDKEGITSYIDQQLGVIENGTY